VRISPAAAVIPFVSTSEPLWLGGWARSALAYSRPGRADEHIALGPTRSGPAMTAAVRKHEFSVVDREPSEAFCPESRASDSENVLLNCERSAHQRRRACRAMPTKQTRRNSYAEPPARVVGTALCLAGARSAVHRGSFGWRRFSVAAPGTDPSRSRPRRTPLPPGVHLSPTRLVVPPLGRGWQFIDIHRGYLYS
jgi:hypothetical protein